jgi:quinoprotein glucose dehydrogenase
MRAVGEANLSSQLHEPASLAAALIMALSLAGCTSAQAQASGPVAGTQPVAGSSASPPAGGGQDQTWSTFNGQLNAQKFATSTQITPANVRHLKKAWQLHTGDVSNGSGKIPATVWSATPLFVNNTLYVGTPFYRIFAVDPGTGKVKWIYNPHATLKAMTQPEMKSRGVAYWQAKNPVPGKACQKIVYGGTMGGKLDAVDADTGKPCKDFGKDGVLNVNQWNTIHPYWPLSILQPPTVWHNTLFIGWAGKDWAYAKAPPGTVFAVDARTGKLKWTFHALPAQYAAQTGTSNIWASMSIDRKHGLLYLPVSSPSANFYGGSRLFHLPYATSITAVDAKTGKVVWSRKLVYHDLWDYDTNAAPTLLNIHRDGKTIPALVQTTKQGYLFVLNRLTGKPVFPITMAKVPKSTIPNDPAAPEQPEVTTPVPTIPNHWPGVWPLANIVSFGACGREAHRLRYAGRFTPPSRRGSITYPATAGGIEWGGGALDPRTNTFVVNSSSVVEIYQLLSRKKFDAVAKGPGGNERTGYSPMTGDPYGFRMGDFFNWAGMPCYKPPFGTISSYDLNTGKLLWKKPFGGITKFGISMPASWGSVTIGGPVITKTGLIFIGASMDSRVRAIDLKTGKVLWSAPVDAPAVSIPAVYTYKGREYVAFTVGGNSILEPKVSDQLVAFALPRHK